MVDPWAAIRRLRGYAKGAGRGAGHSTPRRRTVESTRGHIKRAIKQALLLRGSRRFDDLDAHRA